MESAVRALLSRSHAEIPGLASKFGVEDFGDHYEVSALDAKRSYIDESRDCEKRAEVAAVFVALTLAPPEIESPEKETHASTAKDAPLAAPTPKPEERSALTTSPQSEFERALGWELALGGVAAIAPHAGGTQTSLGAELALSAMKGRWGLKAFAAYESSTGWELQTVPLREARVPMGVLLRHGWGSGSAILVGELGPTAHYFKVRQSEAARSVGLWQFGARGSALVRLDRTFSPYASISLEFLPGAHAIEVEPRGRIGTTASLWLAASLGLVAKLP